MDKFNMGGIYTVGKKTIIFLEYNTKQNDTMYYILKTKKNIWDQKQVLEYLNNVLQNSEDNVCITWTFDDACFLVENQISYLGLISNEMLNSWKKLHERVWYQKQNGLFWGGTQF